MTSNRQHCRENERLREEKRYVKSRRRLTRKKIRRAWKNIRAKSRRAGAMRNAA